jgi:hypothetical protein
MGNKLRAIHTMSPALMDAALDEMERGATGAASEDLGVKREARGGPSSDIAKRKEREMEEKRRQGPPAELLKKHYRR